VLRKKKFMLFMLTVMTVGAAAVSQSAYAQQNETGLKDVYANQFRIGTAYQWRGDAVTNTAMLPAYRDVVLREFNSITHEDDLKPYATMVRAGSTDNNILVTLGQRGRQVLQFCVNNNIPLRGHAFVWHQQTPNWFFWANMQGTSSSPATVAQMNQRMESYIKNLLELIKREYPTLNLYAYDVVNEIFLDNGSARSGGGIGTDATAQNGTDNSPWVQIYGNNSFADSAFVYARKHGASIFPDMKLFYNDYNEYSADKRASMVAMANRLGPNGRGVMDGIGMQSHLSIFYPGPTNEYRAALTAFRETGLEIHVTELDITLYCNNSQTSWCNENYAPNPVPAPTQSQLTTQAGRYAATFREILRAKNDGANITSVTLWGVADDRSWRSWGSALLFNSSFAKKPAYDSLVALIPQSDWGDGNNFGGNGTTPTSYNLTINVSPSAAAGSVTRNPSAASYELNANVELTADANDGWIFSGWSGDLTGGANSITMNGNKNITAHFLPLVDGTENLIKDGNFPGTTLSSYWTLNAGGSSAATSSVSGGKAEINITATGTDIWEPQLVQTGIALTQGIKYRLTFTASAASDRDISVTMQMSGAPYTDYADGKSHTFALAAAEQTFTIEFEMTEPTDLSAQLTFNLGGAGATQNVTISDVKLIYLASDGNSICLRNPARTANGRTAMRVTARSSVVNVSFKAVNSGTASLKLFNLKGDVISSTKIRTTAGRNYSHTFNQKNLPNGFYIVRMQSGNVIEQSRVIVPK